MCARWVGLASAEWQAWVHGVAGVGAWGGRRGCMGWQACAARPQHNRVAASRTLHNGDEPARRAVARWDRRHLARRRRASPSPLRRASTLRRRRRRRHRPPGGRGRAGAARGPAARVGQAGPRKPLVVRWTYEAAGARHAHCACCVRGTHTARTRHARGTRAARACSSESARSCRRARWSVVHPARGSLESAPGPKYASSEVARRTCTCRQQACMCMSHVTCTRACTSAHACGHRLGGARIHCRARDAEVCRDMRTPSIYMHTCVARLLGLLRDEG